MKKLLFLVGAMLLFFAPQIISETFGPALIKAQLEKEWGGRFEIGSISLYWRKKQVLRDVRWTPPDPLTEYSCSQIQWEAPLWDLKHPSKVQIEDGSCKVYKGKWAVRFPHIEAFCAHGAIEIQKTPFWADENIQLWFQGRIDPPQNRLDLVLHIPGSGLKKLFGLKALADDLILEVPLSGDLDSFSMNKVSGKVLKALLKTVGYATVTSLQR